MAEQQRGEPRLIGLRKTRHVRVRGDIGRMLVVAAVRDRHADLVQARGPAQQRQIVLAPLVGRLGKLRQQPLRGLTHTRGLGTVDAVAAHELIDRDRAHVLVMAAAEQVVQHAQPQRAVGDVHAVDIELGKDTQHDRQPTGQDGNPVGLQADQPHAIGVLGLDQRALEPLQPFARDAMLLRIVVHAVQLDQLGQRARRTRRAHRLLPSRAAVLAHQHLDLAARGELRLLHRIFVDIATGEELPAVRNAADIQRLHQLGGVAVADDEFGRAAADIDDQPIAGAGGRIVRRAQVDQPGLLAAGDHLDRKAERVLCLDQELGRVLGHAQRIGGDRAHLVRREFAQAVAETPQRLHAAAPRRLVQVLVGGQARGQPHRLAQRIDLEDLADRTGRGLGLVDAADHQPETVGAHIDGSEQAWSIVHRHSCLETRTCGVALIAVRARHEEYVLAVSAS